MVSIEFLGHSCFVISNDKHKIIIDPFLTGNPVASTSADSIDADVVLLTHAHGDHLGDAIAIAEKNKSQIVAVFELASYLGNKGLNAHAMHIGGSYDFPFGTVKFTPAWHGSAVIDGDQITYLGTPAGILLTMDGKKIYHAGDTGLFCEMELIGKYEKPDVALLPIGDNFTMGIKDAVIATEMIKPGIVVPMHYNTFDLIKANPEEFRKEVGDTCECRIVNPGEKFEI